jgi:hypothetical protein
VVKKRPRLPHPDPDPESYLVYERGIVANFQFIDQRGLISESMRITALLTFNPLEMQHGEMRIKFNPVHSVLCFPINYF